MPETPIWLDCDTGHDDAFAILLAATLLQAKLLGISTVFGNASLDDTTYNTRAILKAIGRDDIPVYAGAARPFCREVAHATDIHGQSGLDGTSCLPKPTVPARTDMLAVQAMQQAICQSAPVWIVATGALTNIALLFALYPDLTDRIAGLSIMGGAIGGGFAPRKLGQDHGERVGNWTAWAEFNIYIDPESASAVFNNAGLQGKVRMVPLDLSHQFIATEEVQKRLLTASRRTARGTMLRKLFVEILTFFAKTYADVFGMREGPPLHDPLAVVLALEPQLFDNGASTEFKVHVVTDGEHGSSAATRAGTSQCGRTVITPSRSGVLIPRTLDQAAIWTMINRALATVENTCVER